MKGKTVFSMSIRGEEFVPTLQMWKLKFNRVIHSKECALDQIT